MRIVIALGGNALLRRGEPLEAAAQRANLHRAAAALAEVIGDHEIVITHGNGPQVGLLALQAEAYQGVAPYPLDMLDAETEGMLGYLIELELSNALPDRQVTALITRVEVDSQDPALEIPTKPIGPIYDEPTARRLAAERGWTIGPDGDSYRRTVASPEPRRILEMSAIRLLLEAGQVVICAGGGGIPVVREATGNMRGIEAVIDKDRSAALLAGQLKADRLLLLTDVPAVWSDWPHPADRPIQAATPEQLASLEWAEGSMGPKVDAACRFVRSTGAVASLGALADAAKILREEAGTTVRTNVDAIRYYPPEQAQRLKNAIRET